LGPNPYEKHQKDLVLRLLRDSLIFQRIGFREVVFQNRYRQRIGKARGLYNEISAMKDLEQRSILVESESLELTDFFNNSFIWITGNYKAKIEVYIREDIKRFEHEFSFHLQDLEKKELEKNIVECGRYVRYTQFDEDKDFKPEYEWVKINRKVIEI